MSISLYIQCIAMYILGQALCLMLFTVPLLKEKCRIANKKFSWSEWWDCDWNMVIGSFAFMVALTIGIDEIIGWKPSVLNYIEWFYLIAGAFGTSIIQERWGSFKKGINSLLDVKSNIADAVTGGTTTVKDTIEKGEGILGQDVTISPK